VVFRNAECLKDKGDIALIARWGAKKSASTLILSSEETKVDKKLEDAVAKENRKIFWELFENQKEGWVRNFFREAKYTLEEGAIDTILSLVDNNTASLRAECSRFFLCFEAGHRVTAQDAENVLAHNRQESAFTLFDALCDPEKHPPARLEQGALVLERFRSGKESSGVLLLAGLSWCFRKLLDWHRLSETGRTSDSFELKKGGFSSPKAQAQYRNAARVWSPGAALGALALIARTDMELRGGLQALESTVLAMLVYKLAFPNHLVPSGRSSL
jgi:DNA polymerase-3 subunit delta